MRHAPSGYSWCRPAFAKGFFAIAHRHKSRRVPRSSSAQSVHDEKTEPDPTARITKSVSDLGAVANRMTGHHLAIIRHASSTARLLAVPGSEARVHCRAKDIHRAAASSASAVASPSSIREPRAALDSVSSIARAVLRNRMPPRTMMTTPSRLKLSPS